MATTKDSKGNANSNSNSNSNSNGSSTIKPSGKHADDSPIVFVAVGDPIVASDTTAANAGGSAPSTARGGAGGATGLSPGRVRGIRIGGSATAARSGGSVRQDTQRVQSQPGEDIVVLTIGVPGTRDQDSGPPLRLRLHPAHARDLLRAQSGAELSAAGGAARGEGGDGAGVVQVPLNAQWRGFEGGAGTSRGMASDLAFKALELVGLDSRDVLAKLAANELGRRLDAQVNEGVYALKLQSLENLKKTGMPLANLPAAPEAGAPTLVLVHGTFVDTASSFGKWWRNHSGLVAQLFKFYGNRVYALDHGTVMRSPIDNALTLARTLPAGARLHLVTHSRGGLVAEVLARAAHGVSDADLALFKGADYQKHRAGLIELAQLLQSRKVVVERIVRVACPAYGTLLASNRLDAYLSVLAWLIERAGLPLLPELVRFADAVARERTDPQSLPGIEAMRRSSAVIDWLNRATDQPAPGSLRVVAGDITGDSLVSWVKTLLADSYYWTDNDLVVQTSSMYGGVARAEGKATFLLDRSGKTDHFHYFTNDRTANAIAKALVEDSPEGFVTIGPLSRQGLSAGGLRALPDARSQATDPSRPAVLVLPGILGSNLKRGDERQWFVWWRIFGLIDKIAMGVDGVQQDGPVDSYYRDLMGHLAATHEVVPAAFDWRVSLSESAALLAKLVKEKLDARATSKQPVRLLAHSMGSVLLRVMRLEHPDVWQRMMQRDGARVLMLGPPNGGSWAPMTIYTGDDSTGRFLSTVGGGFQELKARQTMVQFVGLLQLQAGLTNPALGLADAQHWTEMAARDLKAARNSHLWHNTGEQVAAYEWAVPSQADLDNAAALRRRLDAQLTDLGSDAAKMAIVLGQAPDTPCGVNWGESGMSYLSTRDGDGRVTWDAARLPGVPTWKTDLAHGDLPKVRRNFEAYTELLQRGSTMRLDTFGATARGAVAVGADGLPLTAAPVTVMPRLRDSRLDLPPTPLGEDDVLAAALGSLSLAPDAQRSLSARLPGPPLTVEIVHGDLKFIRDPLLLGHSRSLALTGTEAVLDGLMGHALQQAMDMGLYPDKPGQHQLFINSHKGDDNPYAFPRPQSAIVVGLGEESDLQPQVLADTVRQGVLAYQRRVEPDHPAGADGITLASTTLGSGGSLSVSQSVLALTQGVVNANSRLAGAGAQVGWPPVARLRIIELYGSRAQEAWHALNAAIGAGQLPVNLLPQVSASSGGRSHPPGGTYRSAGYDLVRICQQPQAVAGQTLAQAELEYSLYTRRARSEVRGKATQLALVAQLIAVAERQPVYDADLACSLYQLLVPHELKAYLGTAETLVLEVDADTARYPWEMLDDSGGARGASDKPLTLRLGGTVLRKMRVKDFRRQPADAPTEDVLVIGAPWLEPALGMPELPGASAEAAKVAELFGTRALIDEQFLDIVKAALSQPWKIIHMAGHGIYDAVNKRSGLVMSGGVLFGPAEFESMETVPELVFVNCCHLGKTETATGSRQLSQLAANVAEQLIRNGVRCVVAAGWAVDDNAALAFAEAFYTALNKGNTFVEAVHYARQAAYDKSPTKSTWAAYQCYGDPAWTLKRGGASAPVDMRKSVTPVVPTVDELLLALEDIVYDAQSANDAQRQRLREKLDQLENVATAEWKAQGRVAEKFGLALHDLGDTAKAASWLKVAVEAADGTARLAAREQQLNQRARSAESVEDLRECVAQLNLLIDLGKSPERYALLGSAHKRAAIRHADDADALFDDLAWMADAYLQAEAYRATDLFYPLSQRCLAQLRLHWMAPDMPLPDVEDIQRLRRSLAQKDARDPDFWSVVGQHEASLMEGLIMGDLAQRWPGIERGLHDVHHRVTNTRQWTSVSDTADFLLDPYLFWAKNHGVGRAHMDAAGAYRALVASFAR